MILILAVEANPEGVKNIFVIMHYFSIIRALCGWEPNATHWLLSCCLLALLSLFAGIALELQA